MDPRMLDLNPVGTDLADPLILGRLFTVTYSRSSLPQNPSEFDNCLLLNEAVFPQAPVLETG